MPPQAIAALREAHHSFLTDSICNLQSTICNRHMPSRPRLNRYEWEGVISADFTLDSFRRRCASLSGVLAARGWSCLVAHDTRFMAGQFARYARRWLTSV